MWIHSFMQPTNNQWNACSFACAANTEQATFWHSFAFASVPHALFAFAYGCGCAFKDGITCTHFIETRTSGCYPLLHCARPYSQWYLRTNDGSEWKFDKWWHCREMVSWIPEWSYENSGLTGPWMIEHDYERFYQLVLALIKENRCITVAEIVRYLWDVTCDPPLHGTIVEIIWVFLGIRKMCARCVRK